MLHDIMYLIYWAWTNRQADEIAVSRGAVPISTGVASVLIRAIGSASSLRCKGQSTLDKILTEVTPRCAKGSPKPPLP